MSNFMIPFLLCNIFISVIVVLLLVTKHLFRNHLTNRMHYNLWFLFLGLLAVPFLPVRQVSFPTIFSWFETLHRLSESPIQIVSNETTALHQKAPFWMNDFSIAVNMKTPSRIGVFLSIVWILGMIGMLLFTFKSIRKLHVLQKSALPLQNSAIQDLYHKCLMELNIKRSIPIYSTAFLKSPIIVGLFHPRIYLPLHLICDYQTTDMRYMLLHELQHYKYKDALANYCMNLAGILYWFNPFIWYALKEMKNDREIACDTSVLNMLSTDTYTEYGHTLINFAEKLSHASFPFAAGLGGSMTQMKKRIVNIATYRPLSLQKKLHSLLAYVLIALILVGFIPILLVQASDQNHYSFMEQNKNITYIDLQDLFNNNDGCFVLYDASKDSWQIYNKEAALTRISPVSTYKIYSALFGLETGIISSEQSLLSWNGQPYQYELWNSDQTLESAMQNSVTWYFQTIDQQIGLPTIQNYIQQIGYGNQTVGNDVSSYWVDSSLKISPVEQVELLQKFYDNEFHFSSKNIDTVKSALCLSTTEYGTLYGKTGTQETNGQNMSGWFIGYLENGTHTYFFATNIQNEELATGPIAATLTFSILSDLGLWH